MELLDLPLELLEIIASFTLPDGFESMALACKELHTVCTPFMKKHNSFRKDFRKLSYGKRGLKLVQSAFDLIVFLAIEPMAAGYIREAYLEGDGVRRLYPDLLRNRTCQDVAEIIGSPYCNSLLANQDCSEVVARMFVDSPYLKEAGMTGELCSAKIEKEVTNDGYSQHAAAFLLTLLPNVENLGLPRRWINLSATDKLMCAITRKAKQSHHSPSLAKLTRLVRYDDGHSWLSFDRMAPFLALPGMKVFRSNCSVSSGYGGLSQVRASLNRGRAEALRVLYLKDCRVDEVSITNVLRRNPSLVSLTYIHYPGVEEWNACGFIDAVKHEAGARLLELYVTVTHPELTFTSGRISMRGFSRLERLHLNLDMLSKSALLYGDSDLRDKFNIEPGSSFIEDIIPESLSHLSLYAEETCKSNEVLEVMIHDFMNKKNTQQNDLAEIYLNLYGNPYRDQEGDPDDEDTDYKKQFARLSAEVEKAGVNAVLRDGKQDKNSITQWFNKKPYPFKYDSN